MRLVHGRFAGSTRIQDLEPIPATWMRVVDVDSVATLEGIDGEGPEFQPGLRARMDLGELVRPYRALHRDLLALEGTDLPRAWQRAARALAVAATPFRVVVANGVANRPPKLAMLGGATPDDTVGERFVLDMGGESWARHLWDHLIFDDDREQLMRVLNAARFADLDWRLPITKEHVRRARASARITDPTEPPRVPPPTWWPLVECYAAITLELVRLMRSGFVIHAAYTTHTRIALREELLASEAVGSWLDSNGEALYVLVLGEALAVGKGSRGPSFPVRWCTTHPRHGGRARLERFADLLAETPGCECIVWPAVSAGGALASDPA